MKVIITGASGLVGKALTDFLKKKGFEVLGLKRPEDFDPDNGKINLALLEGSDVIVNLSGESVMGYWTDAKKERIRKSRINATLVIADAIARLNKPPKLLLNASAIGYYPHSCDKKVDEKTGPGVSFLSDVAKEWESVASNAPCRTVFLRFGIILSKKGGALKSMLMPFKLGLGGVLGSGDQYMSYIAMSDLVEAIYHIMTHEEISGPVNIVAEEAVTNKEFTKTLGRVLNRPTFLPVPEFAVKTLFGEMGSELFLASDRVDPAVLKASGFKWKSNNLEEALKKELSV